MFRPTGFADLVGRRVGVFGYGVEGRATARRLAGVAASLVLVDDAPGRGEGVLVTAEGGHEMLLTCDVVLKSPGIARRRSDVLDLENRDVAVCSALNLWLHDTDRSRVAAVTGTKGKSTTTALITFFLECLGETAQGLGNLGVPPYDPLVDTSHGWLIVEVSSFQCVDVDIAPQLIVLTSLGADHLDWHGTLRQYHDDKLSLTRCAGWHRTLVPEDPAVRGVFDQLGGDVSVVEPEDGGLAASLGLLGAHNASNVSLALAATAELSGRSVEDIRDAVRGRRSQFRPLRGRLTVVDVDQRDGARVRFVDDGLATAPLPTMAALDVFAGEPLALIAGGQDRGVDYAPLGDALSSRDAPTLLVAMGAAGQRLADSVTEGSSGLGVAHAASMDDAVALARSFVRAGGVVLFSPAAPSFDRYRNWEERSDDFDRAVRWSLGRDSNP